MFHKLYLDQIPDVVFNVIGVLRSLIDIVYAPINPLLSTVTI
jgi:hypothetical protein